MSSVSNNQMPELRRATRFPVDFETICETRKHGEFLVKLSNISAHGCQFIHDVELNKGDRVIVRLPVAGRIEAFLVWSHSGRSGFEFERVIREPDFVAMLDAIEQSRKAKS
ncbi:MAG: PilZ domain-containing protein [Parasphingorhabdus sp.]|uniref:PilZ domain-containing protein n=1 Tax=Parasphingorhabdus sp. TaxID=2709688 RepID=UPI003002E8CD